MKTLIVERDERGVVSVQLNRLEKRNTIDYQMFQELLEVFDEMSRSDTDRVLVLSGAGGNFRRPARGDSGIFPQSEPKFRGRWPMGSGRNSARSRPRILTLAAHEAH